MATDPKSDALTTLRGHLAAHARDKRAQMFGLHVTLQALDAGIAELQRRQGSLAAAYLLLYEHLHEQRAAPRLHPAVIDDLGRMNDHAGIVARRILAAQHTTITHAPPPLNSSGAA